VGALFVAVMAILSFMGTPWYGVSSSADQEVVTALLPQTHPGPLREAEWEELPARAEPYVAADWANAPTPALRELLHLYEEEMDKVSGRLVNGHAQMLIEDWQADLKRITFRITWSDNPPTEWCALGAQNEFCQVTYYHRTANYWQKP
jgi:hypothetical protein